MAEKGIWEGPFSHGLPPQDSPVGGEPGARGSPEGEAPVPTQSIQYCERGQGQGGWHPETGELGTQGRGEPEQRRTRK